jgi:serine/threonine protein kinase
MRREEGQQPEIVAVKVLKETATREAEEDFMREVDIMSAFRHTNILSLIGVVVRGMVWYMVHG